MKEGKQKTFLTLILVLLYLITKSSCTSATPTFVWPTTIITKNLDLYTSPPTIDMIFGNPYDSGLRLTGSNLQAIVILFLLRLRWLPQTSIPFQEINSTVMQIQSVLQQYQLNAFSHLSQQLSIYSVFTILQSIQINIYMVVYHIHIFKLNNLPLVLI